MEKNKYKILSIKEVPKNASYELKVQFNYLWGTQQVAHISETEDNTIEMEGYLKSELRDISVPIILSRDQILEHLDLIYANTYVIKSSLEEAIRSTLDLKGYIKE
ncbi:hypothetical protein [Oceanotoga phage vB_OteS-UFV02]